MVMDAPTISAFAAAAAAFGAFTVAGIQLFVGYRQSKAALGSAGAAISIFYSKRGVADRNPLIFQRSF